MKIHKLLWRDYKDAHICILWPQNPTRAHTHDFDEMTFILSGTGIHIVEDERIPIMLGDVFVVREGIAHKFEKTKNLCLVNLLYRWNEDYPDLEEEYSSLPGLKTLFSHKHATPKSDGFKSRFHLAPWQLNEFVHHLDTIKKEEKEKQIGYNDVIKNTFKTIVINICRYYSVAKPSNPGKMRELSNVINYINDNLSKKISRDKLIKVAGTPSGTFYKIFRQATGLSPVEYIIRLRISKAAEILTESHHIPITEVALETGFDDSAYFSKKFKEIMGIPPIIYQKNHRMIVDQME